MCALEGDTTILGCNLEAMMVSISRNLLPNVAINDANCALAHISPDFASATSS